ncbi:MAG: 50S ribosomal protein L10 [archaeon]
MKNKTNPVKVKAVKDLAELMKKYSTILIASTANVSSAQLQILKRELKEKIIIKIAKKSIIKRAMEEVKEGKITELEEKLDRNFALIFADSDPFEISAILADKKQPAKLKPGQTTTTDIVIEAGSTDFPVGPLLSELGDIGVKAGVDRGKIAVKERSVVLKEGERVTQAIANVLSQLEIMPLKIGLDPIVAYDSKTGKVYLNIRINKEETLENLQLSASYGFNLAMFVKYPTKENIKLLIAQANNEALCLSNLNSGGK